MWDRGLPIWIIAIFLLAPLAALPLLPPDSQANYTTALSALYSGVSALGAWMAVRALRDERIERSRPVVRADCPMNSSSQVFFRLTNIGLGPAEGVVVTFNPSPVDFHGKLLSENSLFSAPLPLLVPGQEVRHFFQMGFNFSKPDVPSSFAVTVAYRAQGQQYSETSSIDMSVYRDMTLPGPTVEESLAGIAKALESSNRAVARAATFAQLRNVAKKEGDA